MVNIRDIVFASAVGLASLLAGCGTAPKAPQSYGQNFDLAVTAASVEPEHPTTDDHVTLYFTVKNEGPDRAPSSRFFLLRSANNRESFDPYFRVLDVGPIDSGAAKTLTIKLGGEPTGHMSLLGYTGVYSSGGDKQWDTDPRNDSARLSYTVMLAGQKE